ncbi:MAG: ATP-binding protein [Synergistaceae bacterium]|nr:ATP-binding protein [Synergistaceae bacterium]
MLEDLSAHLLDISQNGISAGASKIIVTIRDNDHFEFEITDNGKGMSEEQAISVVSPFFTSRTTRRVGMGLPFLKQASELCGGKFDLKSQLGFGTTIYASFNKSNIDTPPKGDIPASILTLLIDAPKVHWIFRYEKNNNIFEIDSKELDEALDGLESLNLPDVALGLIEYIRNGIEEI